MPALAAVTGVTFEGADAILAAIMSSASTDRAERHCIARHRAFDRVLRHLRELQADRRAAESRQMSHPLLRFCTEHACVDYLAERFRSGRQACRQCGGTDGCLLLDRKAWECCACGTQTGLRAGTILSHSAIPLAKWFRAIVSILLRPTIRTKELAKTVGIRRAATVRMMARRIRKALPASDSSAQLAGLDEYVTTLAPESGGPSFHSLTVTSPRKKSP